VPLVLVPLIPLVVAFALLALHQTTNMWLRPLLDGLVHPKGNILVRVAASPITTLLRGILWIERHVRSLLSHAFDVHAPMLGRWLHGHTVRVEATAREMGGLAADTADSLGYLRHHTLPRVAKSAAAPALERAKVADRTARRSISLTRKETGDRRRSIDRLRRVLGPLALTVLGIDAFVKGHSAREHHRTHTRDIPRIRDRDIPQLKTRVGQHGITLRGVRARLRALERALATGLLAGLVLRTLFRQAPWLRCRNWKRIGPRVCGMNSGLLNLLLGVGGAMFVFAELCHFVEQVSVVAGRVIPQLIEPLAKAGAALCDGEHTAAPPLPLQATKLPDVPNPLPL
jgi:hypothetical protein